MNNYQEIRLQVLPGYLLSRYSKLLKEVHKRRLSFIINNHRSELDHSLLLSHLSNNGPINSDIETFENFKNNIELDSSSFLNLIKDYISNSDIIINDCLNRLEDDFSIGLIIEFTETCYKLLLYELFKQCLDFKPLPNLRETKKGVRVDGKFIPTPIEDKYSIEDIVTGVYEPGNLYDFIFCLRFSERERLEHLFEKYGPEYHDKKIIECFTSELYHVFDLKKIIDFITNPEPTDQALKTKNKNKKNNI